MARAKNGKTAALSYSSPLVHHEIDSGMVIAVGIGR